MLKTNYEIVIIGSGPAGCAASLLLSQKKIHHLIVDKALFPRDKICGDALSGKVIQQLNRLDPAIVAEMHSKTNEFIGSWGVKFAAPNGKYIDIPFQPNRAVVNLPAGYISKRVDFDHFLVQQIQSPYAEHVQGAELLEAKKINEKLELSIKKDDQVKKITCNLAIGCDGDRSVINKQLGTIVKEPSHYAAGIRGYYEGVTEFHEENFIELHFMDEVLPGYLWIFPLPNGLANVGVGMLSASVSKKKVDLKKAMQKAIEENPTIKHRFKNAKLNGKIQGWGLPLGTKKRRLSGDHFLLTGDAGSLIDPFTGEGIGSAIISGVQAGEMAVKAFEQNRYDAAFLESYDVAVYKKLWEELKLSHTLLKLCKFPWLFNFIVNKAAKSKTLRDTISCMFVDLELRAKFRDPMFYLKLLLNK
jgi:geranylgeranyl reductase family protein